MSHPLRDRFDLRDRDGKWLSTASTLAQALEFVRPYLASKQPLLSYVATVAGHYPFALNEEARPPVIETSGADPEIAAIVAEHFEEVGLLLGILSRGQRKVFRYRGGGD